MSLKRKEPFTGMYIPLTEHGSASGEAVELSDHDMASLEGVSPLYRGIRAVFKDALGMPQLVGPEIQMALLANEGEITYSTLQIAVDLALTAKELTANAQREQPLPHSAAVSHPAFCKVLRILCDANRKSGVRLVVSTEDGDVEAPVLNPGDFIEPLRDDLHRQTGTFQITGLYRDEKRGRHGFFLDTSLMLVQLPNDDPTWSWSKIHDVLNQPTYLVGTIGRAGKSCDWRPEAGARLERQEKFAEMQEAAAE